MILADLIPTEFYTDRATWMLWLVAAASMALLALGADRLVSSAVILARALGVSKVIIGATIVSLGTTTPEACVSVAAAFKGDGSLALGNAVGSIIVDTGLIFGLCAALKTIRMDRFVLNRHGRLQMASGVLLAAVCVGLWLVAGDIRAVWMPRAVGVVFLALLGGYLYLSARWGLQHPEMTPDQADVRPVVRHRVRSVMVHLLLLAVGLGVVVAGSELLIGSVKVICERSGVPPAVLAVTLVAFGTSTPELATAIAAIIKGHEDVSVGNIIGADILNVLFVTGAAATASPLKVEPVFFHLFLPTMLVVLGLFRLYVFLGRDRFHRWQGLLLMAVYVVFVLLTVRL